MSFRSCVRVSFHLSITTSWVFTVFDGNVLQHYIRMNEIERSVDGRQSIVAFDEADARGTCSIAISAGFREHRRGYVNANHFVASLRESKKEAAYAASKIQRP